MVSLRQNPPRRCKSHPISDPRIQGSNSVSPPEKDDTQHQDIVPSPDIAKSRKSGRSIILAIRTIDRVQGSKITKRAQAGKVWINGRRTRRVSLPTQNKQELDVKYGAPIKFRTQMSIPSKFPPPPRKPSKNPLRYGDMDLSHSILMRIDFLGLFKARYYPEFLHQVRRHSLIREIMELYWIQSHDRFLEELVSMEKFNEWRFTNEKEGKWEYVLDREEGHKERKQWQEKRIENHKDIDEILVVVENEIVDHGGYESWYDNLKNLPATTQDGKTIEEDAKAWCEKIENSKRDYTYF